MSADDLGGFESRHTSTHLPIKARNSSILLAYRLREASGERLRLRYQLTVKTKAAALGRLRSAVFCKNACHEAARSHQN